MCTTIHRGQQLCQVLRNLLQWFLRFHRQTDKVNQPQNPISGPRDLLRVNIGARLMKWDNAIVIIFLLHFKILYLKGLTETGFKPS